MVEMKYANKSEAEIKETIALPGPDEFLLKWKGFSFTDLMEFEDDFEDWRVTKVGVTKWNAVTLMLDVDNEIWWMRDITGRSIWKEGWHSLPVLEN